MPSAKPIILFGAGPYARLLRRIAEDAGRRVAGFAVDAAYRRDEGFDGLPLWDWEALAARADRDDAQFVVAVGYRSMRARAEIAGRIARSGGDLATIVHPDASVAASAAIGAGCVLFAGVVVEPFAALGANNVLWSGAILCHDTIVGDHNYLAPGVTISGDCTVGDRCFLGTRATVIDHIAVGDDCLIGAGALLVEDAKARGCYLGIPATRRSEIAAADGVRVGDSRQSADERPR